MLKVKKILMSLLVIGQLIATPRIINAASEEKGTKEAAEEIKSYDSLKIAAEDYAKALQEISNYGSREMLKTINPSVDEYIEKLNNPTLKKQWEDTNTMLLEQFEVSVYKVDENKGEIIFLVKGYDEDALNKYLEDNTDKYVTKVDKTKGEVELDIDKYIKLQYDYLEQVKKINLATSTIKFKKGNDNKWKVVK